MATWKYTLGSEKDFLGAPEWAMYRDKTDNREYWSEAYEKGKRYVLISDQSFVNEYAGIGYDYEVIAQRERVTSINDDRLQNIVEVNVKVPSKDEMNAYNKRFDPVDVNAFMADKISDDNVNHPKHYTQGGVECIDAIKAATVGKSGIEAVCVANVVKYLWRYEKKNGVEDVKKARWYLERLIEEMGE